MGAVSGTDLTFSCLGPSERVAILQQRVFCARAVIAFASNVAPHEHLPVLLAMLRSRTAALRHAAVTSVHVLSNSYSGAVKSLALQAARRLLALYAVHAFMPEAHRRGSAARLRVLLCFDAASLWPLVGNTLSEWWTSHLLTSPTQVLCRSAGGAAL